MPKVSSDDADCPNSSTISGPQRPGSVVGAAAIDELARSIRSRLLVPRRQQAAVAIGDIQILLEQVGDDRITGRRIVAAAAAVSGDDVGALLAREVEQRAFEIDQVDAELTRDIEDRRARGMIASEA